MLLGDKNIVSGSKSSGKFVLPVKRKKNKKILFSCDWGSRNDSALLGVGPDACTPLASFLALISVLSLRVLEAWPSSFHSFMVVPFLYMCWTFQRMTSSWSYFHFLCGNVAQKLRKIPQYSNGDSGNISTWCHSRKWAEFQESWKRPPFCKSSRCSLFSILLFLSFFILAWSFFASLWGGSTSAVPSAVNRNYKHKS